jgi:MFS transporter, NNP family, nitrate/nitrite transporter
MFRIQRYELEGSIAIVCPSSGPCGYHSFFAYSAMLQNLFSFRDRYRILHLTWLAFLLTFVCWFNFAPFASVIRGEMHLDESQLKTIAICNIAITIPARIVIGALLDRFGPRITYSALLMFALVPCLVTATAHDFNQLVMGRLLMGIVGSGFVVGIRMVSEWFPPKDIGMAQGIYGGWGNFGAFVAEFALPLVASAGAIIGGVYNWRLAIASTGVIAAIYGLVYYRSVTNTPVGKEYLRPKKYGSMTVTSSSSFYAMLLMNFGLIFALGLLAWRLALPKIHFLSPAGMYIVWATLLALYGYQTYQAWLVNKDVVTGKKIYSAQERFNFRQVALLQFTYITNFGSELAAVSMLPLFFEKTFSLQHATAAMIASSYPLLNLVSRPSGGLISDRFGSRKWTMTIVSAAIGLGYLSATTINKSWPLAAAVVVMMITAYFAQAGCGGTYAIVPLIKPEMTGQIAGNVGAYGNFGGVIYLTIHSLTNDATLFATMGITALVCAFCCAFFLKEPRNSFGTEEAIDPSMGTAQI